MGIFFLFFLTPDAIASGNCFIGALDATVFELKKNDPYLSFSLHQRKLNEILKKYKIELPSRHPIYLNRNLALKNELTKALKKYRSEIERVLTQEGYQFKSPSNKSLQKAIDSENFDNVLKWAQIEILSNVDPKIDQAIKTIQENGIDLKIDFFEHESLKIAGSLKHPPLHSTQDFTKEDACTLTKIFWRRLCFAT